MMQRVLVYGSRTLNNRALVFNALDLLHCSNPIGLLVHGACPNRDRTGTLIWSADMLAEAWAKAREIPYCGWPAQWSVLGRAAGPIRNQEMLNKTRPTRGVEFPGRTGTQDMRARLQKAGVPISRY
jgi:hypothetical protein